jgi:hypothetical protein
MHFVLEFVDLVSCLHGMLIVAVIKPEFCQHTVELHIPCTRYLPGSIEGLVEAEHFAFLPGYDEARRLVVVGDIHLLPQLPVETQAVLLGIKQHMSLSSSS